MDNFKAFLQYRLREPRDLAIAAGVLGLLIGLFCLCSFPNSMDRRGS